MTSIRVKIRFGDDIRRISTSLSCSYDAIMQQINDIFKFSFPVEAMYLGEKHLLPMSCEKQWNDALRFAFANQNQPLFLLVTKPLSDSLLMEEKDFIVLGEEFSSFDGSGIAAPEKEEKPQEIEVSLPAVNLDVLLQETIPSLLSNGSLALQNIFQQVTQAVDSTIQSATPAVNHFVATNGPQIEQFACTFKDTVDDVIQNASTNINDFFSEPASKPVFEGVDGPKLEVSFVSDESIPDGTSMIPGSMFTKTWKLSNTGITSWPSNSALHCVGGAKLVYDKSVHIGRVLSGEVISVSVNMKAPEKAGKYTSFFRVSCPINGFLPFGERLWCEIIVEQPEKEFPFPSELARIVEMGFPEHVSKVVLLANHGNFEAAVNELLNV